MVWKPDAPAHIKALYILFECSQETVTIFFPLSEESAGCSQDPV